MWIECSKQLPTDHGRYLVATGCGTVLFLEYNCLNKKWSKCGTDADYWTMNVMHWQPVPEAPKKVIQSTNPCEYCIEYRVCHGNTKFPYCFIGQEVLVKK